MIDKSFRVIYHRTDTGCLMVWVYHGEKLLSLQTVFSDDRMWFENSTILECIGKLPKPQSPVTTQKVKNDEL